MTTVICIDASSKKNRPTGLKFMVRYEVLGEETRAAPNCVYCGQCCLKFDVGTRWWCSKRFAIVSDEEIKTELVQFDTCDS